MANKQPEEKVQNKKFIDTKLRQFYNNCIEKELKPLDELLNKGVNNELLNEFLKLWKKDETYITDPKKKNSTRVLLKQIFDTFVSKEQIELKKAITETRRGVVRHYNKGLVKHALKKVIKCKTTTKIMKKEIKQAIKEQSLDFKSFNLRQNYEQADENWQKMRRLIEDFNYYQGGGEDEGEILDHDCYGIVFKRTRTKSPVAVFINTLLTELDNYKQSTGFDILPLDKLTAMQTQLDLLQSADSFYPKLLAKFNEMTFDTQKSKEMIVRLDKQMAEQGIVQVENKVINEISDNQIQDISDNIYKEIIQNE